MFFTGERGNVQPSFCVEVAIAFAQRTAVEGCGAGGESERLGCTPADEGHVDPSLTDTFAC